MRCTPSPRLRVIAPLLASLVPLALLPAGLAFAEGAEVALRGIGGSEVSPLATLLRLVAALLVVLLVFWGCASLARRLNGGSAGLRGNAANGLRIVGGLSLGSRERLVVVQAGEEQLLLGVTAGRIERLHVLETPLVPPAPRSHGPRAAGVAGEDDFRARLRRALARPETA